MPVDLKGKPIYEFLTTNPLIQRLRFQFGKFQITPTIFEKDIAALFVPKFMYNHPEIILKGKVSSGAAATYDMAYDSLALPAGFDLTNLRSQSKLVHECIHIYLDNLNMGSFSNYLNEAVAYTAEGVFGTLAGLLPETTANSSNTQIFQISYALGSEIVNNGMLAVSQTWQDKMIETVKLSAHYGWGNRPGQTTSNQRDRGLMNNLMR